MMQRDLREGTPEVVQDGASRIFDSKKLVCWAMDAMALGYDVENF